MRTLLALVASILAVGCGSATSPTPHSSILNPVHVDSVQRANCVGAGNAACDLSRAVMEAMSAGAVPSYISVETRGAAAHWWAIVVAAYRPVGQNGRVDTTEDIIALPDTTFTSGVIIHVYTDSGAGFGGGSTYVGNAEIGGAVVSGSTAVLHVSTQCAAVSGPGITTSPPFSLATCHYAEFLISFDFNLGGLSGTAVGQRINGVIAGPT
jgi:hypothetical protein